MTAAAPRYDAPIRPSFNPWWVRLPILAALGLFLLALTLAAFVLAFQLRHAERIFPGVYAMGAPMSGLTREEALRALSGAFDYGRQSIYTLRDGANIWQFSAAELGVAFDLEATVERAFAVGHSPNLASSLLEQGRAWLSGVNVPPIVTYDQGQAQAKLLELAASVDRAPQNASLRLEGGRILTSGAQVGRKLDVAASLRLLDEAILSLARSAEIPLVIHETPPLVWSVDEAMRQIQAAIAAPIILTATDEQGAALGPWTISPQQIAQLLRVERLPNGDGTFSYQVSVAMDAFSAALESLAPGLIASPRDGRFDFDETTGQLRVLESSSSGRRLNVAETLRRLEEVVFKTEGRVVPLAFDLTLARYHNQISAAELGIRELVAEATTFFTGSSAGRRTNIALAASKFNGVIVAPGEEFSFNAILGPISEDEGYENSLVIYGGRTIEGVGGGACQVSTTIFRAAFNGGFAITERNSHGYRVGYYELRGSPPGLDAAIWQPERDFKFQNNTPYHLLIETTIFSNDDAIQFRFYSTRHWRAEVQPAIVKNLVPPKPTRFEANSAVLPGQSLQVDFAAEGADVTIYRKVYDRQGNLVIEDYMYTHYLPWGAIFQVAPGDPRLGS